MKRGHNRQQSVQAFSGRVGRVPRLSALVLPFVACAAVTLAHADGGDRNDRRGEGRHVSAYAIGLWGDLPYSDVQAAGVLNLIEDMNAQRLAFTVHDGDLKSGGSECTDST